MRISKFKKSESLRIGQDTRSILPDRREHDFLAMRGTRGIKKGTIVTLWPRKSAD